MTDSRRNSVHNKPTRGDLPEVRAYKTSREAKETFAEARSAAAAASQAERNGAKRGAQIACLQMATTRAGE